MEVGRVRRLRKRLMKNNDSKFQRIIRRVNDKILLEMYYNILEEEKEINEIEQETKRIIESNQKDHSQCIPKFAKNDKK